VASSKFPSHWVNVPEVLIQLAERDRRVHCNLRPHQRQKPEPVKEGYAAKWHDGYTVNPIMPFLKGVILPCSVAIHFQGYGSETGSAIILLKGVTWGDGDYPRLDFEQPEGMSRIHGCPNFWGAFVLAIARVDEHAVPQCHQDAACHRFIDLLGVAANPPGRTPSES